MKNKLLFFLPSVLLTLVTLIWYCYEDGRWYQYRSEPMFSPLLILHLLMPVFYFAAFVVSLVRVRKNGSGVFYVASSIVMVLLCTFGFIVFLVYTSGR